MKRVLVIVGVIAVALALWAVGFTTLNSSTVADPRDVRQRFGRAEALAGDTLNISVWNLGYGGLGAGSDFVADGGEHMFPPSRAAVKANVAFIAETVAAEDADVIVFQEIAHDGPVNYWVNLKGRIDRALATRDSAFFADFQTRLLPWPIRLLHGQAIYSNAAIAETSVVPLPAEDSAIFGVKRRYASLVARIPRASGGAGWTIVSVHLAAFDADAAVRTRQLHELLAWAEGEYARGQHVVIAGDWNFQIAETHFPHTTEQRFLFWLFPFPQDALAEGWRIAADASIPSVRTNHKPYVAGENYVTTIDGFIVSPNVAVEHVAGVDTQFRHTDHQPVRIRVRAL
jgi:endonuclease/exonuclease/phosphatase family metal-dependent hydrolase